MRMIPVEAVEAAHKAWREQAALDGSIFEYNLRAALEAAAPLMQADAWSRGHHDGAVDMMLKMENDGAKTTPNPYVS